MDKKKYLSLYLLQHSKIIRLKSMQPQTDAEKQKISKEIMDANNLRFEIENKINNVSDERLKELLFFKYVCGKTLLEISYILNYSPRHTERLHIKALKEFKI